MAAIEVSGNAHGMSHGKLRSNRVSTRVDMTPMVDLGFLLITFFMLATTMSKPTAMSVFFPDKSIDGTQPIGESRVLTLYLGRQDEIYYLDGLAPTDPNAPTTLKTSKSGFELRNVIFAAQKRVSLLPPKKGEDDGSLVVIIKPTSVSSYKNMVDAMDEMAITKSKRYALVDKLTDAETKLLGERISEKK